MIAGLLFLAFAFFAVAQAATVRNGGQTAADAAALGAAEDDRQQFFDGFLDAVEAARGWPDWLAAGAALTGDGCGAAAHFADRNRSDLLTCDPVTRDGDLGYRVRIETRFDTGRTIVPGADDRTAKATATAVLRPRCVAEDTGDDGTGGDESDAGGTGGESEDTGTGGPGSDGSSDGGAGDGSDGSDGSDDSDDSDDSDGDSAEEIRLRCDGEELTIDPEHAGRDLKPSDLFSVVLVE
ncbi:hypothetical protein [Streptomyces qinglanensis]|uniref:Flp pilus-assembly TadG-like N-terminal domain-containing protein n=1 Tax=Streptomyces qinglanensis TaxID=943816 RepID=A0A1H9UXA2_9ACTN|nr:hypothetical protein [Streptomyces qinglanensis]SES13961.1 hypothetical protein SAMN05421870_109244 [Streptomyces qinglanensis]